MQRHMIPLEQSTAKFYERVSEIIDLPVERVLADTLLRTAAQLSMEIQDHREK